MIITLENVRSFYRKHRFPVKPLTLLVGENSSGKTTFLAMLSALFASKGFPARPPFNDPPYDVGSYETIATYRGGRSGRAKYFRLGYIALEDSPNPVEVVATYVGRLGQPVLQSYSAKGTKGNLSLNLERDVMRGELELVAGQGVEAFRTTFERSIPEDLVLDESTLMSQLFSVLIQHGEPKEVRRQIDVILPRIFELLHQGRPEGAPQSVAPVRTKPKRTYDEISDEFKPEGDHIPLILARVFESSSVAGTKQREQLRLALEKFGEDAGLFREVSVKRFGSKPSDPFQLLVSVAGRAFNLPDVGYGVSQSLPIVVQSILAAPRRLLLLQQPEVHLHPKAQAALGSFLARLVAAEAKRFVVETHSDFLVDRIRQEVAEQRLDPGLVQILFFSRKEMSSSVHPINLDVMGNVVGSPGNYREFFLREEQRMFTFDQTDVSNR